jgi:hypothetical protein
MKRDSYRAGASLGDGNQFGIQSEFAGGAIGVKDDILIQGLNVQSGENMVMEEVDAIQDR